MASTPKAQMTDNQRTLAKSLDAAVDSCIAYAAAEVPPLGNLTPQGLVEELGRLNEARKAMDKTEKTVRSRLDALLDGKTECRGDNFVYTIKEQDRTALDQTAAKAYLSEQGILEDYMKTTTVQTRTVKRV